MHRSSRDPGLQENLPTPNAVALPPYNTARMSAKDLQSLETSNKEIHIGCVKLSSASEVQISTSLILNRKQQSPGGSASSDI